MKRIFLSITVILLTDGFASCKLDRKTSNTSTLTIDTAIKAIFLQKIWNLRDRNINCVFSSKLSAEFYKNDSLVETFKDSTDDFWGRYWWHNDTLTLTGIIGDLSSIGFIADIYRDKTANIYVNECAHESKKYKINPGDSLSVCVKVPCDYAMLKISNIPYKNKNEEIYGFVSFKSKNYYCQSNKDTSKLRSNMTFYFKACNFDFHSH